MLAQKPSAFTYQDYLRSQFVYKEFEELPLKRVPIQKAVTQKPKSQLCEAHFLNGQECLFSKFCIFAHSVSEVQENDEEYRRKFLHTKPKVGERRLF